MQSKERIIHHEIPGKPWKILGPEFFFFFYNKYYLTIVGYHSKFAIIKKTDDFSVASLILPYEAIFAEYRPPKKNVIHGGKM